MSETDRTEAPDILESIFELAEILCRQNDYNEMVRLVVRRARDLFHADSALIMMLNPRTRQTVKTVFSEKDSRQQTNFHFVHALLTGWVLDKREIFFSPDLRNDTRFRPGRFRDVSYESVICAPFISSGMIIGTLLLLYSNNSDRLSEAIIEYTEKFTHLCSPFLHNTEQIDKYFRQPRSKSALRTQYEKFGLLGESIEFIDLLRSLDAAAGCDVQVVLEGESGTGKELIARAIHAQSPRSEKPFIAVDCGAIPPQLIESELFGHVKGAFTGASHHRHGLFKEADQGTLFLDEISNLPRDMQAKLLRALQEKAVRPVGSNTLVQVDVRIITASSTPLHQLLKQEQFRHDLYYRLYVYPIPVPTLKERDEDIPLLAYHFLNKYTEEQQKSAKILDEHLLEFLRSRQWKGNVRELQNCIHQLVTLANTDDSTIGTELLSEHYQKELQEFKRWGKHPKHTGSLVEQMQRHESRLLMQTLEQCKWNQSQAAKMLGISEPTIRYKMKKCGIKKPE